MKNLIKAPSIVKMFMAEFLSVLCVSGFILAIWNAVSPGVAGAFTLSDKRDWLVYVLGLLLFAWSLREILRPRVKRDSWTSVSGADSGGSYSVCTTHPSYVLVDLVTVAVTAFFLWAGLAYDVNARTFAVMFALAVLFPALRLFAWYVLGLRIEDKDETEQAWKPAAMLAVPFFAVFALVAVLVFIDDIKQKRRIAGLPVVDEQTFGAGRAAFNQLLDGAEEEKVTRFVRLRARQTSDGPARCKNYENFDWATVPADLGAGGDVLIVGHQSNDGFEELVAKSSGNRGNLIEAVGRLREMPRRGELPKWKAYCGRDDLPPPPAGGRWVLELGEP